MSIYNSGGLENLSILFESKEAYKNKFITSEELYVIETENKNIFYIPKLAIRIGLFLAVIILTSVVFGLLNLMFYESFQSMAFISVFMFFVCLIMTYFLSVKKMHFGSGADNAFLYSAIIFLMIWFASTFDSSTGIGSSFILFIICTFASIIFLDRFLAIVSFVAFLGFVYYLLHKIISLDILMLFIMLLSLCVSVFSNKYLSKVEYWNKKLLKLLLYSSLIAAFVTTNNFYLTFFINEKISYKIVFNLITAIIPFFYIMIGIKFNNIIFLRCGIFLVVAAIFSFISVYSKNNFFEFLALFSAIIVGLSWWFSRFLLTERNGYVFQNKSRISNIESVGAINSVKPPTEGFSFGGGSFGGGGASGEF